MLIEALSTGHKIGLAVTGVSFIVFALVVSLVIPRKRPDFPGKRLGAFIAICVAFFVAMMLSVIVFGKEPKEAEAGAPATTQSSTTPAATTPAETTPAAPSAADVAKGKTLYTNDGCIGCHSLDGTAGVGPTWKGLYGSQVALTDGTTVTADDAYLTKSIEDPDAQIVQGFRPGIMSATIHKGFVPPADAAALVAYIQSVK